MDQIELKKISGTHYNLMGDLNIRTVMSLKNKCGDIFGESQSSIEINFKDVKHADGAGLALIVEWSKQAEKKGQAIVFSQLPKQIVALVKVCGLNSILSIK